MHPGDICDRLDHRFLSDSACMWRGSQFGVFNSLSTILHSEILVFGNMSKQEKGLPREVYTGLDDLVGCMQD